VAGANRRRLARLEAARGGGAQADRLRAEVERLTVECEREPDDRRFCAAYLRLLEAEHRLHLAEPAPEPVPERPAVDVAGMADDEFEAFLNSLIEPDPRRDPLHARFREAADGSDAERYLSLFQAGGACA
jgi:hypothetical protein